MVAHKISLLNFLKLPEVLVSLLGLPMDSPALEYAEHASKITSNTLKVPKSEVAGSSRPARSMMQMRKTVKIIYQTSY